jgi:hypothetical protein
MVCCLLYYYYYYYEFSLFIINITASIRINNWNNFVLIYNQYCTLVWLCLLFYKAFKLISLNIIQWMKAHLLKITRTLTYWKFITSNFWLFTHCNTIIQRVIQKEKNMQFYSVYCQIQFSFLLTSPASPIIINIIFYFYYSWVVL